MYEITVRVPESVENNINTEILLKSKTPGGISIPLKIIYDNSDRSVMTSQEDFQRAANKPIQTKKEQEKTNKTKKQPEAPTSIEYEEQPVLPPSQRSDDKSSSFSSFIVLVILILFGLTMFDNNLPSVSIF